MPPPMMIIINGPHDQGMMAQRFSVLVKRPREDPVKAVAGLSLSGAVCKQ